MAITPSDRAELTVAGILHTPPIRKVNFRVGNLTISPLDYYWVRKAIWDNHIKVQYSRSLKGEAEYEYAKDRIFLGFTRAASLSSRALIVHECTHAIMDLKKRANATVLASEIVAYIAQCVYARASSNAQAILTSSHRWTNTVFTCAWPLAEKVLKQQPLVLKDLKPLMVAIARHPDYKKRYHRKAGYDGVRGEQRRRI